MTQCEPEYKPICKPIPVQEENIHGLSDDGIAPAGKRLKMITGSCYLPKPGKIHGEDAHFICEDEQAIGVADGVSAWAKRGVDSGEFSRNLMSNAARIIKKEHCKGGIKPLKVLKKAFSATEVEGSTTALIVTFDGSDINAVNVGDSGFMVIRDGRVPFRSKVQQHKFNQPYQIGKKADNLNAAEEINFRLVKGDFIVAATDGLFDNLFEVEVVTTILESKEEGLSPPEIASKLVELARERAKNKKHASPFSLAARHAGKKRRGGKMDDITVIVVHIATATDA